MSQFSDETLIKWITARKFSKLTFLDENWRTSKNERYLGFYYFIQEAKREPTTNVLSEIVTRLGSESKAYSYLGDIATQLYNGFDEEHISTGFYRKSTELDSTNAEANWGLYKKNSDYRACLRSLSSDYQTEKFEELANKLRALSSYGFDPKALTQDELKSLKDILLDDRLPSLGGEYKQKILLGIYYYLGDIDAGLTVLDSISQAGSLDIKPYYEHGQISKELALSKVYTFQVGDFLDDDHRKIYEEHLNEFNKEETKFTLELIIQKAFRAEAYQDVIDLFEQGIQDDAFLKHDKDARLYYLLAQLQLGQAADHASLTYVNERLDSLRDDSKNLFSMLRLKQHMLDLERHLSRGKPPSYNIRFDATYQAAGIILDNSELLEHFLFESFESELKQIKQRWDSAHCRAEFEQQKQNLADNQMELDDFPQLWGLAIDCQEYDYAIESVATYHQSYQPDMTSYNVLGVCYDCKGELETALEYYQQALKLKQQCQQRNYIIISNYVDCAQRLSNAPLSKAEFRKLRNQFNADLISEFKWQTFTAKNSRHLYKYSPFNINTIDSLTNQYFYLAGKKQLNDPIEFPDLEGVGPDKLVDENYRICSLSNNNNSMLMWSHYAQEHRGIMVEYWFGGELPEGLGIDKVRYSDDVQRNRRKERYTFNQYVLTKNKEWAYEDEVRLFSNLSSKFSYDAYQYPNPDYSKIHARVASITLGYKFPADKRDLIVHLVTSINSKRSPHEPKVVLKEAYIAEDNNFSLKYRDLDI